MALRPSYESHHPSPTPHDVLCFRHQQGLHLGGIFVLERSLVPGMFPSELYDPDGILVSELDAVIASVATIGLEETQKKWETHWLEALSDETLAWLAGEERYTAVRLPIGFFTLGPEHCVGTPFEPYKEVYRNAFNHVRNLARRVRANHMGVLLVLQALPGGVNSTVHSGSSGPLAELWNSEQHLEAAANCVVYCAQEIKKCDMLKHAVIGLQIASQVEGDEDKVFQWYEIVLDALRLPGNHPGVPFYLSDVLNPDTGHWSVTSSELVFNSSIRIHEGQAPNLMVIDISCSQVTEEKSESEPPESRDEESKAEESTAVEVKVEESTAAELTAAELTAAEPKAAESKVDTADLWGLDSTLTRDGAIQFMTGGYLGELNDGILATMPPVLKGSKWQISRSKACIAQKRYSPLPKRSSYFWTFSTGATAYDTDSYESVYRRFVTAPKAFYERRNSVLAAFFAAKDYREHDLARAVGPPLWPTAAIEKQLERVYYEQGWIVGWADAELFKGARAHNLLDLEDSPELRSSLNHGVDSIGASEIWILKRLRELDRSEEWHQKGVGMRNAEEFERGMRDGMAKYHERFTASLLQIIVSIRDMRTIAS